MKLRLISRILFVAFLLCVSRSTYAIPGADYVLITEHQIFSPVPLSNRQFGRILTLDGDTLAVSGIANFTPQIVEIRKRNHGGVDAWGVVRLLENPFEDGAATDLDSLDLSGDFLLVGDGNANDNQGAAYLFNRNAGGAENWGLVHTFQNPTAGASNEFGQGVAIDGGTVVIGAASRSNNDNNHEVFIFGRNSGGADAWGLVKTLSMTNDVDEFGESLDLHGDTLVVGSSRAFNGAQTGEANIYYRNQGGAENWGHVKEIISSEAVAGHEFGHDVVVHGDTIVASALSAGADSGRAYVFERNEGGADNWGQVDILAASDAGTGDAFGARLALFNDSVLIGSGQSDDAGTSSGSAYLFQRNAGGPDTWGQVAKILPSDTAAGDRFGNSVALSASHVVIGAPLKDETAPADGSVYIYPNECLNLVPEKFRRAPVPGINERFGQALDIWGDAFIAGDPNSTGSGQAHIYYRNQGGADNWGLAASLEPEGTVTFSATSSFGKAVAMWNDTVVVGAEGDSDKIADAGVALVFERNQGGPDNWGQTAALSIEFEPNMAFGSSVAIYCDTIVVGAPGTEVSGEPSAGAAFVFHRNEGGAGNWGLVTELLSDDPDANDQFGTDVAVFGDTIAVGAIREEIPPSPRGGAVFLFQRHAGGIDAWNLAKEVTSSDMQSTDHFGASVALYSDILMVGAPGSAGSHDTAYVFERDYGGINAWGERAKLSSPDYILAGTAFGQHVDIWDDLAVVTRGNFNDSAGYLYQRNVGGADAWGYLGDIEMNINANRASTPASLHGRRLLVADVDNSISPAFFGGAVILLEPECIVVDSTADNLNGGDGSTTLREAITEANATTNNDCILLPAGIFTMSLGPAGDDLNASGDYDILDTLGNVTIKGVGAKQTYIDGDGLDRVFEVHPGASVQFEDLSIKNGMSRFGGTAGEPGGGIYNRSTTTLYRVMVISNKTADGVGLTSGGSGGGIACTESLFVYDSTIAFNTTGEGEDIASGIFGGDGGRGGGIFAQGSRLHVRNSTISGNATGDGGTNGGGSSGDGGRGGGIYNASATAVVEHATIAFNSTGDGGGGASPGVGGDGGGIFANNEVTLYHTIISDNTLGSGANGPAGSGSFDSLGYNIVDSLDDLSFTGDITGNQVADPDLDSLDENGGPTCTHYLQNGSPAIDTGDPLFVFGGLRDQRGALREPNARIDIGAVETTVDFDNDNVPDDWEIANGQNAEDPGDSIVDLDLDGFTGEEEYIANTDPFDGNNFLRILSIEPDPLGLRYTYFSESGRSYDIERATVGATNWGYVNTFSGIGTTQTIFILSPLEKSLIRVRAKNP